MLYKKNILSGEGYTISICRVEIVITSVNPFISGLDSIRRSKIFKGKINKKAEIGSHLDRRLPREKYFVFLPSFTTHNS